MELDSNLKIPVYENIYVACHPCHQKIKASAGEENYPSRGFTNPGKW